MSPNEYERHVAQMMERDGYAVEITARTGDMGVDIIATKEAERLSIQAKMYGDCRRINAEMVLQLEGARRYFDCTRAMIATDGDLTRSAQQVAEKLNIEIRRIVPIARSAIPEPSRTAVLPVGGCDVFDRVWSDFVVPLQGQVLTTLGQQLEITIQSVDWRGITRISSNGRSQFIPIEIFRWAIRRVLSDGAVTRDDINDQFKNRASSAIVTILALIPEFKVSVYPIVIRRAR